MRGYETLCGIWRSGDDLKKELGIVTFMKGRANHGEPGTSGQQSREAGPGGVYLLRPFQDFKRKRQR